MRRFALTAIVIGAAVFTLAASESTRVGPGEVTAPPGKPPPSSVATPTGGYFDDQPGGPVRFFRATGENCYLVFSNYGLFGCYGFVGDHGFHYDVGSSRPPEKYQGLYSWTDAPTLINYNNYVETTTRLPIWLELPAAANTITVEYWAKWNLEQDFDGVELEFAVIGEPTNWRNLQPTSTVRGSGQTGQPNTNRYYYEGQTTVWKKETVDLTSYKGSQVKFRFHFRSDYSNRANHHGFYVDEFRVVRDSNTDLYYNGFESKQSDKWINEIVTGNAVDEWGFSEPLSGEINFLNNAQLLVGSSSAYVCDAFSPDWVSTSVGWDDFVTYSNAETRSPAQPEFRVQQYMYAYRDYVIVDCYVQNGKPERQTNVYAGVQMNLDVRHDPYERDDDERVIWIGNRRLAMFYDDGQLDQPVVGLMFLHQPDRLPTSVNFTSTMGQWTDDAANFNLMSNGEKDFAGTPSPINRWLVVMGDELGALNMSEIKRFSFAVVGGDDEEDLLANADEVRQIFPTLPQHNENPHVVPTSVGKIKALFQ